MTGSSVHDCSYVIAFRNDDAGLRLANLLAVIKHVQQVPNVDIVVVECDETRHVPELANIRHEFLQYSGPFNKSWAMNIGFTLTHAPVVAFGDADLIAPHKAITTSIRATLQRFGAAKPFGRVMDLPHEHTTAFLEEGTLPDAVITTEELIREDGEDLPYCGGLFMIRRELFKEIGGYDERFSGWGGEDDALSIKLRRRGVELGIMSGEVAYHLWHGRALSRYLHANYPRNRERVIQLGNATDEEMRAIYRVDAGRMGNPTGPQSGD